MIYCLIGSTKFKEEFGEVNWTLSKLGHTVLSVAAYGHADKVPMNKDEKETLDLVHLQKIMIADEVIWVTNEGNYIGESTRRELKWAHMMGKPVHHCNAITKRSHNYSSIFNLFDRCYPNIPDLGDDNTRFKENNDAKN